MKRRKETIAVGTRLPKPVFDAMMEAIKRDLHVSKSDFVRDAIKDYIERNWPYIFAKFSGVKVERLISR